MRIEITAPPSVSTAGRRAKGAVANHPRVVHVITDLARIGGAERMLTKLAHVLPPLGIEMSVVSLAGRGELGAEIEAAGVPVTSLRIRSPLGLPRAVLAIAREIRARDADIVQTWLYHSDLLGTIANAVAGRRLLSWSLRNSDITLDNRVTAAIRWLLSRLSGLPAAIVSNSRAGLLAHRRLGYRPRTAIVIPNGFDTETFQPDAAARAKMRSQLNVGPSQPLIGMVARVAPMKDHRAFLDAARMVATQRPDIVFVLAGAGTEPGSATAAQAAALGLGDRMRLLGRRSDIPALFAAFDLVTLSSANGEGFPNVLGEAMACGTPCVTTDVGDASTIIGDTGIIVPPRSPEALARAWLQMIDLGSEKRKAIGDAARQRIVNRYGIEAIGRRYARMYRRLAALRA